MPFSLGWAFLSLVIGGGTLAAASLGAQVGGGGTEDIDTESFTDVAAGVEDVSDADAETQDAAAAAERKTELDSATKEADEALDAKGQLDALKSEIGMALFPRPPCVAYLSSDKGIPAPFANKPSGVLGKFTMAPPAEQSVVETAAPPARRWSERWKQRTGTATAAATSGGGAGSMGAASILLQPAKVQDSRSAHEPYDSLPPHEPDDSLPPHEPDDSPPPHEPDDSPPDDSPPDDSLPDDSLPTQEPKKQRRSLSSRVANKVMMRVAARRRSMARALA